jgi:hypothetical protein
MAHIDGFGRLLQESCETLDCHVRSKMIVIENVVHG